MKKLILGIIFLSSFIWSPVTLAELAPAPTPKLTVQDLVNKYSIQYNVSSKKMIATLNCENKEHDPTLQSRIIKNGKREQSYGLSQIHLPSHPDITLEQATDPDFSIEFMAKNFSNGNAKIWSCYRMLFS